MRPQPLRKAEGRGRRAWAAFVVGCGLWVQAQAQTLLDDIDVRAQGEAQVVRIRFNVPVRYQHLAPTTPSDLYTLRFDVAQTDETAARPGAEEFRRLPAGPGLPEITVSYQPDANRRERQLTIRLSQPRALQARQGPNARSIEIVVSEVSPPAAPPAPVPSTLPAPPPRRFLLRLEALPQADKASMTPIPKSLQDLEVVSREVVIDGVPSLEVSIGYFATAAEAEAVRAIALPRFARAVVVEVEPPPPTPVAPTAPAAPAAAALAGAAPSTPASAPASISTAATAANAAAPEIEREAALLIARARDELAAHRADAAAATLNQLLKLPPNAQSMAAQELIGSAWEQAENPARARAEYALYLKLYPQGEGAARVEARLAALGGAPVRSADAAAPARAEARSPWNGSIAQYYYGGKARTQSLVNIATGIDQATLSKTTESSIVTSVDLSGRLVGADSETRAVVRGSAATNLIAGAPGSNSIGAAYVEHRRSGDGPLGGLAIRAGRQSPISGGLLGLFDGVSLAYPVGAGLKLDVMGGVPANALVSAPAERLLAAVLEADSWAERWGGNFYVLDQSTQGITNRRALGAEVRYAGERWSVDTLADYDAVFKMLNALSLHASLQAGGQSTVTLLVDQRRAPSLQLTNALISSGAASLQTLLQTQSLDQVRDSALATSAIARQFLVSVARPLNPSWQMSTDLRYSAVGALPAVGDFAATAATGGQYGASAQLTGTNLYSARDINNFNLSVTKTPFFKGVQFAYNNLTGLPDHQDLTLEPSIRLYTQRDNQDVKLTRVGPGLRLSWRASRRTSLLGELLYETSHTDGPTNHDSSNSVFFYVGYRHELF